jgi:ABC-type transport system involved in cytochrome bd biosynthesis fused ATPase/permease subunit
VALAAVLGARALLGWAAEVVAQRISGVVKSDLRGRVLAHAVALGPRWASEARSGETVLLATRGLDALDGYFARYLPQLALAAIACGRGLLSGRCIAAPRFASALIPVFMVLVGRMAEARRRGAGTPWRAWPIASTSGGRRARARPGGGPRWDIRRATDVYRVETMGTLQVAFLSALC